MLYMIKVLYTLIFPPSIFIIGLLIIAVGLFRRKAKIYSLSIGVISLLLAISSMPAFSSVFIHQLEYRYSPPALIQADVLVMLTGGAVQDSPDMASGGNGHLQPHTAARLLTLAELYRQTELPILLSGGQVFHDTGNESRIAKRNLIALGIPESAITMDDTSRNTEENASNTKYLLELHHWEQPLLITSAFHMARSVKQFHKLGIAVTPFPTDYSTNAKQTWYGSKFIPSSSGLHQTGMALKEYLGLLAIR
jgi:uncharacterized SAM-binding protein YcdF (DUF218 family)